MIPLSKLRDGEPAVVVQVSDKNPVLEERLKVMGFVPGSTVMIEQRGPLGSPINIRVMGSLLSLRRSEAESVGVHLS